MKPSMYVLYGLRGSGVSRRQSGLVDHQQMSSSTHVPEKSFAQRDFVSNE